MFSLKKGSKIGGIILSYETYQANEGAPVVVIAILSKLIGILFNSCGLSSDVLTMIPTSLSASLRNV